MANISVRENVNLIKTDVAIIKNILTGNGTGTGLVKKVESNSRWRYLLTGGLILLSLLFGWGVFNLDKLLGIVS